MDKRVCCLSHSWDPLYVISRSYKTLNFLFHIMTNIERKAANSHLEIRALKITNKKFFFRKQGPRTGLNQHITVLKVDTHFNPTLYLWSHHALGNWERGDTGVLSSGECNLCLCSSSVVHWPAAASPGSLFDNQNLGPHSRSAYWQALHLPGDS